MRNVPKLRFKEYSLPWKEAKLANIAKFSKGRGVSKADVSERGVTDCIRYGELYTHYKELITQTISKTDIPAKELILSEFGDVILPASGETAIDISTASCVLKQGVALGGDLNIIKSTEDSLFLAYYLNNSKKHDIARLAQGVSVVHLYGSHLASLKLNLPTQLEQQKVAAFLTAVDTKIEQLTKKEQLLKQYKKGVMQKLFNQEIRFKADDGSDFPAWVKSKLGRVTSKVSVKNKDALPYPVYSISNKYGFIPQDEQFEGVDSAARNYDISMYKIVGEKTFAYNPARINVGSIGYSGKLKDIIISSLYVCFKTSEEIDDNFFRQYVVTFDFNKNVLRNVEGGVRDYLFYENFSAIKFRIPSLGEQEKIAEVLSSLDKKISHISDQLTVAKTFKKGLLQQMFV